MLGGRTKTKISIDSQSEQGKVGGCRWASYRRFVLAVDELNDYAQYERRGAFVFLGSPAEGEVLEQVEGSAMGGRFSVFKCSSVFLARREGRFILNEQLRRLLGIVVPGLRFD